MSKERNEIKDDIKYVKNNLVLGFKFFSYLFLYFAIVSIGLMVLGFYLDKHIGLSVGLSVAISLIYFLLMILLYATYIRCKFKNICKEECIATLVHSISLSNNDNLVGDLDYAEIWLIMYQYENEKYTRIIHVWHSDIIKMKHQKFAIKICKYFPKLIYIEKEKKDKNIN